MQNTGMQGSTPGAAGGQDVAERATTVTVVSGAITVLIMDFFLTKLFLAVF